VCRVWVSVCWGVHSIGLLDYNTSWDFLNVFLFFCMDCYVIVCFGVEHWFAALC
jgi:hypothetical protein